MAKLIKKLSEFAASEAAILGASSFSWLNLGKEASSIIYGTIAGKMPSQGKGAYPEYFRRSLDLRCSPQMLHPWAKTIMIFAFPYSSLPDVKGEFIPSTEDPELAGMIAGYAAGKLDYHWHIPGQLAKFADSLRREFPGSWRFEICVDTKPVAEKSLAAMAGVGDIGMNSCLISKELSCGFFLAEIFTDLEFPAREIRIDACCEACLKCGRCMASCPTGALSKGAAFDCSRCRSHLTMGKKGMLGSEEIAILGDWISGCDICTASCPGNRIPAPYPADLEWILSAPSSEIRLRIKDTALEYAGPKLLKRNALAVLANRKSVLAGRIIANFAAVEQDEMLRTMAESVLNLSLNKLY